VITRAYVGKLGERPRAADIGRFLWSRFARVWPVWILVTLIFAVVLLVTRSAERADSYSAHVTMLNTIEQLLMVQLWSSDTIARTSYVVPGWSLSAEWLAYVCFPLLAVALFRLRRLPWWVLAAGSVALMTPFALTCLTNGDNQDLWLMRIAGGFLAGALMSLAVLRIRVTPRVERLAAVVAVVAVGELLVTCWWSVAQGSPSRSGAAVVAFPVLVGALAISREGLTRALSTPLMQVGGRISYSLYLLHTCVFLIFETIAHGSYLLRPGGPYYMLLLPQIILLTIPVSYLLWRYVEEPSRRWLLAHPPRLPVRPGTGPDTADAPVDRASQNPGPTAEDRSGDTPGRAGAERSVIPTSGG
jgi:peptidoglycan/LPS O-acetylase OafA/YrhL